MRLWPAYVITLQSPRGSPIPIPGSLAGPLGDSLPALGIQRMGCERERHQKFSAALRRIWRPRAVSARCSGRVALFFPPTKRPCRTESKAASQLETEASIPCGRRTVRRTG